MFNINAHILIYHVPLINTTYISTYISLRQGSDAILWYKMIFGNYIATPETLALFSCHF
jgi:hypothetical protein